MNATAIFFYLFPLLAFTLLAQIRIMLQFLGNFNLR